MKERIHIDPAEVVTCQDRIQDFVHRTPVLTSTLLNDYSGAELYFKCENFQKMGAFKIRGATNAVLQLNAAQKHKGVLTHSSGNFAQALALAARDQGIKAYIVMPENAPQVKVNAVRDYGAEIIMCHSDPSSRESMAEEVRVRTGATFIHPSDNKDVIIGQGTAALELFQDYQDLDFLVVPVGGGGLIGGSILAAQAIAPMCKVIGAEPFEADDAFRSLASGKIELNLSTNTIADGLRTYLGEHNFPIILAGVERIVRLKEGEIVSAMRLIWERMKIIVEPSSAICLAAVLSEKEQFAGKRVGILLSGGNVDLAKLPF
jgi:threonine dehydratase